MKPIEFDCGVGEPFDIIVTPAEDRYDPEQNVIIVHITNEGLIIDFFTDGEQVGTTGQTWQEWWEEKTSQ
jgi:hypothetical protein